MKDIRVLLVDDHPVVRAGLRAMLTAFEGISVATEAADGEAALKELKRLQILGDRADVVLENFTPRVLDKLGFRRGLWFDEPRRDGGVDTLVGCSLDAQAMFGTSRRRVTDG